MKLPKKYSHKIIMVTTCSRFSSSTFSARFGKSSTYVTQPVGYVGSPVASVY